MVLPKDLKLNLTKYRDMRYGENPHQQSAFYVEGADPGFEQLAGIELSHNNVGDSNHAWNLVSEFSEPTVAIIKHGNPSGLATRADIAEAFRLAYKADSISAYGGIIAVNQPPTVNMVAAMRGIFFELIVAPDFDKKVLQKLNEKSSRLRIIRAKMLPSQMEFTRAFNGYLVQTTDTSYESKSKWKVMSGRKPDSKVYADL